MIGHRHTVLKRSKDIMERCILIHNRAFLEYEEDEEKADALGELGNLVKIIGTAIEQCKEKEIDITALELICINCEENYLGIIRKYPWLSTFDFHPGAFIITS